MNDIKQDHWYLWCSVIASKYMSNKFAIFCAKCKGFEIVRDSLHTIWFIWFLIRFPSFLFSSSVSLWYFELKSICPYIFLLKFHDFSFDVVLKLIQFDRTIYLKCGGTYLCMNANFRIRNERKQFRKLWCLPGKCDWLTWQKQNPFDFTWSCILIDFIFDMFKFPDIFLR